MTSSASPIASELPEAPAPPWPASIIEAFLTSCRRTPGKPCILFEGQTITYEDLARRARRWAGALAAWGLQPGDRVALFLENSPDFLAAYLGTHFAGGIVVLVNTQYRQVELRHILSDSGARLCVVDVPRLAELERVRGELPELEAVVVVDEDVPFLTGAIERAPVLPAAGDVALLAYTSGTTGRAKGAMLTHGNLAANSWAVATAWRWTADDVLLLALPLFHVHGLCVGIHGTWLTGATAELHRRFDAAVVYERLLQGAGKPAASGGITMFFGVPTMYTRLIAQAECRQERPAPLRLYVSGSAPLSIQTFEAFERLFGQRILERYGMSETIMNLTNPYDGERRPGTVGQPFPGQEARIVDVRTRRPILDETPGEIQVRGPHVFKGYWRRPEATAEAFDAGGWFNTGDLGWRSADGYFTISGRARELIISGGYNIYPREVEEVLLTHPAVADAAVFGLPDLEFGEQVAAAIVPRRPDDIPVAPGLAAPSAGGVPAAISEPAASSASGAPAATCGAATSRSSSALSTVRTVSADELIEFCRQQLASYKKPRRIFFVDQLPRNALGKVQKHLLQEHFASEALEAPRS